MRRTWYQLIGFAVWTVVKWQARKRAAAVTMPAKIAAAITAGLAVALVAWLGMSRSRSRADAGETA